MEDMFFLNLLLHSTLASVKYGIIINQGTPNHLTTKKKKISYLLQSPCSVYHVDPFCCSYQHYKLFCSPRFPYGVIVVVVLSY